MLARKKLNKLIKDIQIRIEIAKEEKANTKDKEMKKQCDIVIATLEQVLKYGSR